MEQRDDQGEYGDVEERYKEGRVRKSILEVM